MADQDPILEALVRNTEALTNINATMASFQQEFSQSRQAAREHGHNVLAKLDNNDRSVSELRLAIENGEKARKEELRRIFELLTEERRDRRDLVATAGADEKALIREIIREELGERRKERHLIAEAAKAVWTVGGKYIVLAISILFVALVMKLSGLSLADILGLAGK